MCVVDGDPPRFYREEHRKARKTHRCHECGRDIQRGEQYRFAVGYWEDLLETRACAQCTAAQQLLVKHCGSYALEGLGDELIEHFNEVLPWRVSAGRLLVAWRRKWQRVRGDGLVPVEYIQRVVARSEAA